MNGRLAALVEAKRAAASWDGARLRAARVLLKISQKELGEALGVNNTTVAGWEAERGAPNTDLIIDVMAFIEAAEEANDAR